METVAGCQKHTKHIKLAAHIKGLIICMAFKYL